MSYLARTTKQLGAIIRRQRKNRGLTQGELGAKIGLRQATISRLEAGEPATQMQTLLDALTALELQLTVEERTGASPRRFEDIF